jgi:hypothetical protein
MPSLEKISQYYRQVAFGELANRRAFWPQKAIQSPLPGSVRAQQSVRKVAAQMAPKHARARVHSDGHEQAGGLGLKPAANAPQDVGFPGPCFPEQRQRATGVVSTNIAD